MEVTIVNQGVSYTREIVKFNDFKAILRVQHIRRGGQCARKYGNTHQTHYKHYNIAVL